MYTQNIQLYSSDKSSHMFWCYIGILKGADLQIPLTTSYNKQTICYPAVLCYIWRRLYNANISNISII